MKDSTPIYEIAHEFSENTSRAVFLTGKAGTGKTTFLRNLRDHTRKQIAVVAPTGVAAINAGGVTIHSFFQLPFTPFAPTEEGRKNLLKQIKMTNLRRKIMRQLEILVIDEISMVRADILDEIDTVLRAVRYNRDEPFGGVQVIYIGDLYQLPPVTIPEEWAVIAPFYPSPYFFDSQVARQQPPIYIELDKIFRQTNADFIQLLNEVRNNCLTPNGFKLLQSRFHPGFTLSNHPEYIFLTTHNASASRINREEMSKLKGKTYRFTAKIQGEFPEKTYPNDEVLELKKGAKVMFIANDGGNPRQYYNGKIAVITDISEDAIFVRSEEDDDDILVTHETWENKKYNINRQTGQIEESILGTFTQYPLRLAWAITIHKSQGLTFDKAIVDAANSFSSGQVYVALSRCRSLEGLILNSPIRQECLTVDASVVSYASQKLPTDQLKSALQTARDNYNEELLRKVFDFRFAIGQIKHLQANIHRHLSYYNDEGIQHANDIQKRINELQEIGIKFQWQIHSLFIADKPMLKERLKAARNFFCEKLDELIEQTTHSPAEIFDGDASKEYKDDLEILFLELSQKSFLIDGIHKDFSIEGYYKLKDRFRPAKFKLVLNDIYSEMEEKEMAKSIKKAKKTKKSKEEKQSSYLLTLQMHKNGIPLEKIAEQRELTLSTIEGHIARCIKEKKISADDFLGKELKEEIQNMLKQCNGKVSEVFSALEGNVTYGEIRMAQAEMNEDD